MKIAFGVVTFRNSAAEIARLLNSLKDNDVLDSDVYLLENSHNSEPFEQLSKERPALHTISATKNTGYAGGNNLLLDLIFASHYDLVCICNPDIKIAKNSVQGLRQAVMLEGCSVGLIGGVERAGGSGNIRTAFGWKYSWVTSRAKWRAVPAQCAVYPVPFVQGAFVGFTRLAYDSGVRLHEGIRMYYDEVALGFEVAKRGLSCVCSPLIDYTHFNNSKGTLVTAYWHHRNRVLVSRLYNDRWKFLVFTGIIILIEMPLKLPWGFWRRRKGFWIYYTACCRGVRDGFIAQLGDWPTGGA